MKYRKLGNTGLEVSEIGFGTWGLGGDAYGPVDDNVSKEALRFAFDLGVTFYDTADLYGNGHSEEVIGEALKSVREMVNIATKVGTLPHSGFYMPQDFSPKHIREGLEASLRRLRTDYIDLYQLHSPPIEALNTSIIETLESLQKEGKIRAFAVSVRSPSDGLTAIEKGFKALQVNFNLIDHRAIETNLFALARRENVGIIARTPLAFGYLTGTLKGDENLGDSDHRAKWPTDQLDRWAKAPRLFSFLNEGKNRSLAQLALKFCLAYGSVSTVIPGMVNVDEVQENVRASDMEPLTSYELTRIRNIYKVNRFYDPATKGRLLK